MNTKECKLFIDNEPFRFKVEGDFFWGAGEALYEAENNIISKVPWTQGKNLNVLKNRFGKT